MVYRMDMSTAPHETPAEKELRLRSEYAAYYASQTDAELARIVATMNGRSYGATEPGKRRAQELVAAELASRGAR